MTTTAPCPFCGSASKPTVFDFDGYPYVPGYEVRCDASGWGGMDERGCGASSGWGETREEAIAAWNRRTPRSGEALPKWFIDRQEPIKNTGEAEPVAWVFELASWYDAEAKEYTLWDKPQLSFEKPTVPAKAIRNLRPLVFASERENPSENPANR